MKGQEEPALFFLDDGYPESREYDDNYVFVQPKQSLDLLRRLLGRLRTIAKARTSDVGPAPRQRATEQ